MTATYLGCKSSSLTFKTGNRKEIEVGMALHKMISDNQILPYQSNHHLSQKLLQKGRKKSIWVILDSKIWQYNCSRICK